MYEKEKEKLLSINIKMEKLKLEKEDLKQEWEYIRSLIFLLADETTKGVSKNNLLGMINNIKTLINIAQIRSKQFVEENETVLSDLNKLIKEVNEKEEK